jgi:putative ABC transport system permease protein
MKSFEKIAYKYLKSQKKRSVLTIVGIVLSVALFTSIGTMLVSFQQNEIKNTIQSQGDYHARLRSVTGDKVEKLKAHVNHERIGVIASEGFALIYEYRVSEEDIRNTYLSIENYDKNALEMLPVVLLEGRLPEKQGEIVIEEGAFQYLPEGLKIGDIVELSLGTRTDTDGNIIIGSEWWPSPGESFDVREKVSYTLTGILKSNFYFSGSQAFKAISLPLGDGGYIKENNYNLFIRVKDKTNIHGKLLAVTEELEVYGTGNSANNFVSYNSRLLTLTGDGPFDNVNKSLLGVAAFLAVLIMVSTILVIYNIFQISVLERISQFGILRSIGASPKQIKRVVLKEANVLSAIGIPLGILSGLLASRILILILSTTAFEAINSIELYIDNSIIITSIFLGLLTVYFSTLSPAVLAGRVSPLEAVRNTGSIRKENIKRRRGSFIIRKLFKIEGELAYKNIKRSRKRFNITVASLVISIILFIVFNTFMSYVNEANPNENRYFFDLQYYKMDSESTGQFDNEDLKAVMELPFVEKAYKNLNSSTSIVLEDRFVNEKAFELRSQVQEPRVNIEGNVYSFIRNSNLYGYHSDFINMCRRYLLEGEIDEEKVNKENGVILIHNSRIYDYAKRKVYYEDMTKLSVGDEILLDVFGEVRSAIGEDIHRSGVVLADNANKLKKVKIIAIIDKIPMSDYGYIGPVNFITSEEIFSKLTESDSFYSMNISLNKEFDRNEALNYFKEEIKRDNSLSLRDYFEEVRRDKQINMIIRVFLYGFVTIIVMIGSLNILNTVNTNLILRKREFAALKAIGMAQGQVKKQVWLEGALYGIIASIYGGIIGTVLTYIMYRIFDMASNFDYSIPWSSMMIATIGTILITLSASLIPLKNINDSNIIESIRMEE